MTVEIVPLTAAHLDRLPLPPGLDVRAYFSVGSIACCVLADGVPVFAGGIVNLQWNRGEAWILPTPWMKANKLSAFRAMRDYIPRMADIRRFRRVQAVCIPKGSSTRLFKHLGFKFEARLDGFGPEGETCCMWSRIFEVTP